MRQKQTAHRFFYPPVRSDELNRECYLTGAGVQTYRPGETYPCEGHPAAYEFNRVGGRDFPDFALVAIVEGQGSFNSESHPNRPLKPGDIACLVPGRWHEYHPDPATGWKEVWFCLNGAYLYRLQKNGRLPRRNLFSTSKTNPDLLARIADYVESVLTDGQSRLTDESCFRGLSLLSGLADMPATNHNPSSEKGRDKSRTAPIVRYMHDNAHRPISPALVCRHFKISRRTLERHFREEQKTSPGRLLHRIRLDRARQTLLTTDMPIKAVAYSCGFGSPQRLIYDFNQTYGLSPKAWRDKHFELTSNSPSL